MQLHPWKIAHPFLVKTAELIVFAACLCIPSCTDFGSPTDQTGSWVDGKTLFFQQNETFTMDLDVCADAGYTWTCSIDDSSIVRLAGTSYRQKALGPPLVGGLGVETLRFSTVNRGQSVVTLSECQPWMKNVPPMAVVRFVVVVN